VPESRTLSPLNWLIIGISTAFFFIPLFVTGLFSLWEGGNHYGLASYGQVIGDPGFWASFLLSFRLAAETIIAGFVLLVPAMIFVHLKAEAEAAV
jgi:putative spermidine/putrescine transport system permease protein